MTKSKMLSLAKEAAWRAARELPEGPERTRMERKGDVLSRLQMRAAARALKQRYGSHPFYAERAKTNPRYWQDLAASAVHA